MRFAQWMTAALIMIGGAVAAHQGVQNPAVMARMDNMTALAQNIRVLAGMQSGKVDFDAKLARLMAAEIANHAAKMPDLFRRYETDPKSEARLQIWDDFDDFSAKAIALRKLALKQSTQITQHSDLRPALGDLGASCKACHALYRE